MDERFQFGEDELRIGDLVFRLGGEFAWDAWKTAPKDRFLMFKPRALLEIFDDFFSSLPGDFAPRNIFEIGIWDGGSVAFWFEYFHPEKLVAVDILTREDSDYFRRYVDSRAITNRIKTHWRVDQGDPETLREIVETEFSAPLDLVIDDGSHLLDKTTSSFETLFPLLRKGGLYVIEDWAWELVPQCRSPDHAFASKDGLIALVTDLVRVTGSDTVIRSMTVQRAFVAVERGSGVSDSSFELDKLLSDLPSKLEEASSEAE